MNPRTYAAFLFDMDGTVIDSIAVAERIWGGWAKRHGLDVEVDIMDSVPHLRRLLWP